MGVRERIAPTGFTSYPVLGSPVKFESFGENFPQRGNQFFFCCLLGVDAGNLFDPPDPPVTVLLGDSSKRGTHAEKLSETASTASWVSLKGRKERQGLEETLKARSEVSAMSRVDGKGPLTRRSGRPGPFGKRLLFEFRKLVRLRPLAFSQHTRRTLRTGFCGCRRTELRAHVRPEWCGGCNRPKTLRHVFTQRVYDS